MVRIISEPSVKQVTCYVCKAKLEYSYGDITTTVERDYGGGSDKVSRIKCPCCQTNIAVSRF